MDRLKGKIALITGAGTGVGRACMKLFAAEGAKVIGVSRTQANLDETLAQVKAASLKKHALLSDEEFKRIASRILSRGNGAPFARSCRSRQWHGGWHGRPGLRPRRVLSVLLDVS